ncbi:MAG: Orn/Lys/Arg decarboxylase N-terminal domain-containing protein [Cetobacterium sp.]|uniref:Orn/Lys/Arg family decarboxylase n=1 Tax=Cetobacterium sp. TaxID=2071632 RepID=UPI002FCC5F51
MVEKTLFDWPLLIYKDYDENLDFENRTKEILKNIPNIYTNSLDNFYKYFSHNQNISGIILINKNNIEEIVDYIRNINPKIPIVIFSTKNNNNFNIKILKKIDCTINIFEDTVFFITGQISNLITNYMKILRTPFFSELVDYTKECKYAWHTPGHSGGTMFLTNPIGKIFFDFYGENTLRSDLSISVPELGSLLDDEGPIKSAEINSARVFSADKTYYVLNGTSSVNQIIWKGRVTEGDIAFVDRNCHKSLNYGMVVTEATPFYMIPRRNKLGIIGPVNLNEFSKDYIEKITKKRVKMSALTNSTYDGICYNINKIKETLNSNVDNLHFDEAWYAYAKFHPLYAEHFAMTNSDNSIEHPPIFASQSTHKLLGAFSQASMLQVKDGTKEKIDFDVFNQAYMMYSSTSPQYSMLASLDVATAMMDYNGKELLNKTILDAIHFRKYITNLNKEAITNGDWFFSLWQPKKVVYNEKYINFEDVPDEYLLTNQSCWTFNSKNNWHGFEDIEDNYVLLDPIKLTIICPGITLEGEYGDMGIPASILSRYITLKGVVNEKTDTYSLLFLHTIGTTQTKQEALIQALIEFKKDYDNNTPLECIFPKLVTLFPEYYSNQGLKDHCQIMHNYIKKSKLLDFMDKAFEIIPNQILTPAQAAKEVFRCNIEHLPVKDIMNRIAGVMVVPYPPGIPILMGGEKIDKNSQSILDFLLAREKFERIFPGYYSDIHGIKAFEDKDGIRRFHTMVIKE